MTAIQALQAAQALGLERLDAQYLLLHVVGKGRSDRAWLLGHGDAPISTANHETFIALARRRVAGEPLAYLTGRQAFYGLELALDERVLIPRPDTETLVDWALAVMDSLAASGAVLDLGTGSGAVALALKHCRPAWRVRASDISRDALAVAQANAARLALTVSFSHGNWFDALPAASSDFDLIVSNPPYIADDDTHLKALTHEPQQALTSGADGLDAIRHITAAAPARLRTGGWLLIEHGYDQAQHVRDLLAAAGLGQIQSRRDLAGIERCSGGQFLQHEPRPLSP